MVETSYALLFMPPRMNSFVVLLIFVSCFGLKHLRDLTISHFWEKVYRLLCCLPIKSWEKHPHPLVIKGLLLTSPWEIMKRFHYAFIFASGGCKCKSEDLFVVSAQHMWRVQVCVIEIDVQMISSVQLWVPLETVRRRREWRYVFVVMKCLFSRDSASTDKERS